MRQANVFAKLAIGYHPVHAVFLRQRVELLGRVVEARRGERSLELIGLQETGFRPIKFAENVEWLNATSLHK